jgi:hypothetical protein
MALAVTPEKRSIQEVRGFARDGRVGVDRQFNIKRWGRSGPLTTELDAVDREADVPKPCGVTEDLSA